MKNPSKNRTTRKFAPIMLEGIRIGIPIEDVLECAADLGSNDLVEGTTDLLVTEIVDEIVLVTDRIAGTVARQENLIEILTKRRKKEGKDNSGTGRGSRNRDKRN